MHMPIGWEGLGMPNDRFSVHLPIIIINSKLRGAEQDSVPYIMEVVLNSIPVECEAVDPCEYRILNGSIYGIESCSTSLSLELEMIMGMYTKHPSVGMLSPSQPIGMHIEQEGILDMLRHLSIHIEHFRTNIRHSNSPFSSGLMKSSSCLDESLSTIPTGVLLRESIDN